MTEFDGKQEFYAMTQLPKNRDLLSLLFEGEDESREDAPIKAALDALDLSPSIKGDNLYLPSPGEFWPFYNFDGYPLTGDIKDQAIEFGRLRALPEAHLTTSFWTNGTPLWVSTVYLGTNYAHLGGPPLVWETMLQIGLSTWSNFQVRYCTRAAAMHGHQLR